VQEVGELMADYSGYWHCNECGVSGSEYSGTDHKDTCSVPGKLAKAERERQLAADEAARIRAEQQEHWDSLDDDQLLVDMGELETHIKRYRRIVRAMEDDFDQGLLVMKRRNLLGRWLKLSRGR
jgi:hypothetical protein